MAALALIFLAASCKKENSETGTDTTYIVSAFVFDNGIAADATSLRSELDSYCISCKGKKSSEVKEGAQKIVDKYAFDKKKSGTITGYKYSITITSSGGGILYMNESAGK